MQLKLALFICLSLLLSQISFGAKPFGFQQLAPKYSEAEGELDINYPQNYFTAPMDIPMFLSGTFGELRSNHFHSGIDIKTNGVVGKNILAAAEGYISRVKISPWGYGKAVYINHPNGFTTVYAHLDEITGELGAYIKAQQYNQKSFEVNLFPGKNRFTVSKCQVIAKSGNSGGSGGPHLHFEIRETATERPLNPLHFGFAIQDNSHPVIQGIQIHPLTNHSDVNGLEQVFNPQLEVLGNGSYTLRKNLSAAGTIGISVNTFDRQNGSNNQNGVYSVELLVNNERYYLFKADKLDFNETRYLNALIDYERFHTLGNRYHKTFIEPGNRLNMYPFKNASRGEIEILPDSTYQIELRVTDIKGNTSTVDFSISGKPITHSPEKINEDSLIRLNQGYLFQTDSVRVQLPSNILYRSTPFTYKNRKANSSVISSLHQILDETIPAHTYFTVKINGNAVPAHLKPKACIVSFTKSNTLVFEGNKWEDDWLVASTRSFGTYSITADTVAPRIVPKNLTEGVNLSTAKSISFTVSDDLSGVDNYNGYIDGKWILMDYDPKSNLLTYQFDEMCPAGKHEFKLVLTDKVDNKTVYSANFIR